MLVDEDHFNYYLVEDFNEDDDLGYYDSEEEFDDSLFNKVEQDEIIIKKPIYSNIQNMKLPIDMMKEILIKSTIPTFVKLCNSSKDINYDSN
jgi:hypothetical protein